jgi:hypothetical protein
MSAADAARSAEVAAKLHLLREALAQAGAGAIRLRGADWFAWAAAGADASPLLAGGGGVAELLVTPHEACVLTDETEAGRLRAEQLPDGFSFHIAPWAETELHDTYVLGAAGGATVLSDRPRRAEAPLPAMLRLRRCVLGPDEQARYRALGRDAALALGEALRARCWNAGSSRRCCWSPASGACLCSAMRRPRRRRWGRARCCACARAATACMPAWRAACISARCRTTCRRRSATCCKWKRPGWPR